MQTLQTSIDCSDTDSDSPQAISREAQEFARLSPESLSELSDSELQSYIVDCAERFCAAQKRYEATGCFTDAGDRDRFWNAEAEALRVRGSRPNIVARMERQRGLA